ncbi:coproporphyrinogen-III oxidase family protein [Streptomyces sp. NPDC020747]|uniref:coproporphyrinogen-III oxidase family protein n=2 Tax=unclassified Streptomyces TaxID=2593676 RepID=UPI00379B4ABE
MSAHELRSMLDREVRADYAYMYPPRQAYSPLTDDDMTRAVNASLNRQPGSPVNLYLHFPFCEQICGFCNLYAVAARDGELVDTYITTLLRELAHWAPLLSRRPVATLYFGGGTPSLLTPAQLERVLNGLQDVLGLDASTVPEVAMEVSPSTVEHDKFRAYRTLGINRVNLGFQSLQDTELKGIGRAYTAHVPLDALQTVQDVGFENVCVDLIYGLPGQDRQAWRRSVDEVVRRGPETVCAYALTLRPSTGFAARGYTELDGPEQYAKYDYVDEQLRKAGYQQQTHVRWARGPSGGYRQKENHWALQPVIGIGAGARGYLWECDYRNGYSVRHRMRALREYFDAVARTGHGRTGGFLMTHDERCRKAMALGLIDLDLDWYYKTLGEQPGDRFSTEITLLKDLELLEETSGRLRLTQQGIRHRDVLVQLFFSQPVKQRLAQFDYDE